MSHASGIKLPWSGPVLDRLEEVIITSLIGAATLLIFVSVVHRYASGISWLWPLTSKIYLSWAQELCIYMFVWMAKFGAAYGVRQGIHVGVDVVVNMLETKYRNKLIIISVLAGILFTFVIGSMGARFVWHMSGTGQTSSDLEVPMWIVYLAIPLGSYLMCFRFVQVLVFFLQTGEMPAHDHAYVQGLDTEEGAKS